MRYLYLLIDLATIFLPVLFSFHPRIRFNRQWKYFFSAALPIAIIFIIWDIIFTRLGIWSFNKAYTLGFSVFDLPVEEILFFICIPFACVFTYYCLDRFYKFAWPRRGQDLFCIAFSMFLLYAGIISIHHLYTSVTLISTAFVCLTVNFYKRGDVFGKVVSVYIVLLIPFSVVNGILTGTGLEAPVVRYNNTAILGIRLMTIPVEDVFYGLELVLANVFLFEQWRSRRKPG